MLSTISATGGLTVLIELRVENYAVIDCVEVSFGAGLNLLTGETGAGKSILIDALSLLLGEKASSDVVRHGTEKAVVSGVFEAEPPAVQVLEANGIDGEDGQLILRREIAANGKGRVFVNNQPATVAVLKQLAAYLAVIHAQNDSTLAFDPPGRLALLDAAAGLDPAPLAEAYRAWSAVRQRISELERDEQDRLRLLDLWSFQLKEIESVRPEPGEDQKLEAEKRVLANAERIYQAAMAGYDALYDGASSALVSLKAAAKQVEELSRYDSQFQPPLGELDSIRITIEDLSQTLRNYAEQIDASPERLASIEERLAALDRLRRKYGKSIEEVLAYGDEIRLKIEQMENKDQVLRQLKSELAACASAYAEIARAASRKRYAAARRLEKLVEAEINDLAMKARFKIEVDGSDDEAHWTTTGFDAARYLIATNPGEPLGPVEEIASGGELSRVMLALKACVEAAAADGRKGVPTAPAFGGAGSKGKSEHGRQRTLVFDEIDSGIGGRAADAVGKKLKTLARSKQVLCVTHLPQIACFADQHFLIEKREAAGRSQTHVRRLAPEERKHELARMLSGTQVTEASLKNAEQMLKANA
jgi:DNA repair protein RecN (Recombination protein N)